METNNNYCAYCDGGTALVNGRDNKGIDTDKGIAIHHPDKLVAYGYDVHGFGSNGLMVRIKYCPMCGRDLDKNYKKNAVLRKV